MYKKEIERKWLVDVRSLPDLSKYKFDNIKQAYLSQEHDSLEVRVRSINDKEFYLVIKDGGTKIRNEITYTITKEEFEISFLLSGQKVIKKKRYYIPSSFDKSRILELDFIENPQLVIVEYETDNEILTDSIPKEKWFGEEVTEDIKYKNSQIAYNKASLTVNPYK
ncbi:MAG: hypothetical protein ACOC3V_03715 [bacterium]